MFSTCSVRCGSHKVANSVLTRQRAGLIGMFVLAMLLVSGCSGADAGYKSAPVRSEAYMPEGAAAFSASVAMDRGGRSDAPAAPVSGSGSETGAAAEQQSDRKLVKRGSIELRVDELAVAEKRVLEMVETANGWISSTNERTDSLYLKVRVPHEAFDSIMSGMGGLGKTLGRRESTEDVTLQYFDLQGRLETKQQLRDTFRGYLRTAKNIEEILAVETRLNELQNEIDSTGAEFRRLANLVDYATIDVNLSLPARASDDAAPGLGERLGLLFGRFGGFLQGMLLVIVGAIVYGIPVCAVLLLFWHLLFGRIGLLKLLFKGRHSGKAKAQKQDAPAS